MLSPPDTSILREAAQRAIGEDVGPADLTTQALVPPDLTARARIFSKEPGILCGGPVAERVFRELSIELKVEIFLSDGESLSPNDPIMTVDGPVGPILTGERSALNFLQHLSGIATRTQAFVAATSGTQAKILDTRKTIPGLRHLQKYAVACGGGVNHRMGLYDAIMIKDNHLEMMPGSAGFADAVAAARTLDPEVPLIVEVDRLDQLAACLKLDIDRILLDNMNTEILREAVLLAGQDFPLEASGNMTLERIPEVAATGVDYISVGALTHSVQALDFSLEIDLS